jgi:AcrR family transcriptional regulator
MLLFWRHGYEGSSITQLTEAMGINPPSLYAAFGSKEQLYREAMKFYLTGLGDIGVARLNDAPNAREGVANVLEAAAAAFTRPGFPSGCMIGVGSLRCAEENRVIAEETAALRKRSQAAFSQRLARAQRDGEIPNDADIVALTDFFSSIVEGMSVQAQDGASRERLLSIGRLAMTVWPGC